MVAGSVSAEGARTDAAGIAEYIDALAAGLEGGKDCQTTSDKTQVTMSVGVDDGFSLDNGHEPMFMSEGLQAFVNGGGWGGPPVSAATFDDSRVNINRFFFF